MLVIFQNTVLNIEVRNRTLKSAGQVASEVLDALQEAAIGDTLTERFLIQLKTTTETDWHNLSTDN